MDTLRRGYGILVLGWTVVAWSGLPVEPKIALTILSTLFVAVTLIVADGEQG